MRAMPLLAVKPAGSSGPLRTSYAPTAITDIPATILDLIGIPSDQLPGRSALQIDTNVSRRRTYAHHSWGEGAWGQLYLDLLHVFSIDGRITDPNAWTFQAAIFEPVSDVNGQLKQHRSGLLEVEFGGDGPFQWGDIQVVTYLPADARVFSVSARKAPQAAAPQTLTVRIDGRGGGHPPTRGQLLAHAATRAAGSPSSGTAVLYRVARRPPLVRRERSPPWRHVSRSRVSALKMGTGIPGGNVSLTSERPVVRKGLNPSRGGSRAVTVVTDR